MMLTDNLANMPKIQQLFEGEEVDELFTELRAPNPKKRLKVIVAFKKII